MILNNKARLIDHHGIELNVDKDKASSIGAIDDDEIGDISSLDIDLIKRKSIHQDMHYNYIRKLTLS